MDPLGTLKVGDAEFTVTRLQPLLGVLRIYAFRSGPAELAVPRAEWFAPDDSLICTFEPFRVSEADATNARHPATNDVTVVQDIHIAEIVVRDEPSPAAR